jgi:hypothetical protein
MRRARFGSRRFCLLLTASLLALPSFLAAEHWVAYTDRQQNPLILELMQGGDLDESLQAARALGLREDNYVSDILSGLLGRGQEAEILFLLRAMFPPGQGPQDQGTRLSTNREGLGELAEDLEGFGLELRREVVRVLRLAGDRAYDGPVLSQAGWLRERFLAQAGRAETELAELALEVLAYAGSSANPVFLDPVLRLKECARTAPVASRASEAAAQLARTAYGNPGGW